MRGRTVYFVARERLRPTRPEPTRHSHTAERRTRAVSPYPGCFPRLPFVAPNSQRSPMNRRACLQRLAMAAASLLSGVKALDALSQPAPPPPPGSNGGPYPPPSGPGGKPPGMPPAQPVPGGPQPRPAPGGPGRPPPPPRHERRPPPPHAHGYIWTNGHWRWHNGTYVWVSGRWISGRKGWRWVPGRWVRSGPGWVYIEGYWAR
ncbi:YXWGXW repeat-containing protein [Trinickia violacea]|uniref:YXWGXW repeat-containing protein n=1 Tax=Trinickia violacea TaxID=2571746 RepID=UPI003F5CF28F